MSAFKNQLSAFFLMFLLLGLGVDGFGQVILRGEPRVINPCVTEYTMGSATQDQYVIIVFTCSSTWTSSDPIAEFSRALVVAGGGGGGKRNDTSGTRGAGGGGAGGVT